jgi:hypothetical protein
MQQRSILHVGAGGNENLFDVAPQTAPNQIDTPVSSRTLP